MQCCADRAEWGIAGLQVVRGLREDALPFQQKETDHASRPTRGAQIKRLQPATVFRHSIDSRLLLLQRGCCWSDLLGDSR
jgi:hypothetical protein